MAVALALLALLVAVVALGVALAGRRRPGGPPAAELDAVPEDVLGLRQEVAALRAESGAALRHVALVRYDAFPDSGGRLSWSVALLDDAGAGIVLTTIHGRSEARTYARSIADWTGDQLSAEESEAIALARP